MTIINAKDLQKEVASLIDYNVCTPYLNYAIHCSNAKNFETVF